jgi:DNA-binding NarL/FixJ family response regulator
MNTKIKIAIAEDNNDDLLKIQNAIKQTNNCQADFIANNGRELILKLLTKKQLPSIILMDMQMPACDGLLTTIICKKLFPSIKIIGLSSHTSTSVIGEFLIENGDAFFTKFILVRNSVVFHMYNDENIFENKLNAILFNNEKYVDILCQYNFNSKSVFTSTQTTIEVKHANLSQREILFLQLNAAGFSQVQMASLLNKSIASVKKYNSQLLQKFNVTNSHDLAMLTLSLGIIKIVALYQQMF